MALLKLFERLLRFLTHGLKCTIGSLSEVWNRCGRIPRIGKRLAYVELGACS